MNKRPLGSTGIEISPIGLGTVKFGRNQQVKYLQGFELPCDRALANLLAKAKDLGVNFLDTAPAYGTSEQRLGKLLQGQRQQWILSSKVGEAFVNGQSSFHFDAPSIIKSVENSLRLLKTDYLDLILVHSNGEDIDILEKYQPFDTLSQLKDKGLIRAFGMSTKTIAGAVTTLEQSDVAMITYHLGYTDEEEVIDLAREKNKGILIKKALSSGHLVHNNNGLQHLNKALNFVLTKPGVTSAVVGTINPKHLSDNVRAIE